MINLICFFRGHILQDRLKNNPIKTNELLVPLHCIYDTYCKRCGKINSEIKPDWNYIKWFYIELFLYKIFKRK